MTVSPILAVLALEGDVPDAGVAADLSLPPGVEITTASQLTAAVLHGLTSQYVLILEPGEWLCAGALAELAAMVGGAEAAGPVGSGLSGSGLTGSDPGHPASGESALARSTAAELSRADLEWSLSGCGQPAVRSAFSDLPRRAIVFPGARVVNGQPQWDTPANRQLSRWAGREVSFEQVPLAAEPGVGRCVPVRAVQAVAGLWRPDQSAAWWAEVFLSAGLTIRVPNPEGDLRLYQGPDQTSLGDNIGRSLATWQALVELNQCYDQASAVRAALTQAEARRLGARVCGDQAGHAELVAALQSAARETELTQVNQAAARRLVVSYAFPPFLDTAGLVAAKRVAGWAEPFDLICHNLTPRTSLDQRTLDLVRPWLGQVTTVPGAPRTHREASLAAWCRTGLAAVRQRERQFGPYELMYSRSMWPASQVLAALLKARQPDLEWTAELSDPLLVNSLGQMRQAPLWESPVAAQINQAITAAGLPVVTDRGFFGWLEGVVYALADGIIMTNSNQCQFMMNYPEQVGPPLAKPLVNRLDRVLQIESQPVPPTAWYDLGQTFFPPDDVTRIRLAYFGVFYATRGVDDVLRAFVGLNQTERQWLRFDLFTNKPDEVTTAASAAGLSEVVKAHAMLPYLDFLATAKHCDWLIVADAQTTASHGLNPYRPSKLSDYRGSGARIWGLVEPGSAMSREPLDASTNLGDPTAATAMLRRIIATGSVLN